MNPKWAEENLHTIRTLMERSALYRRALAPVMLLAGGLGIVAAAIGISLHFDSPRAFGLFWLATAIVAVTGALFVVRRQALKAGEQFWSAPTRRVALALSPPLFTGFFLGMLFSFIRDIGWLNMPLLPFLWAFLYGCALHSAGFFMPRGVKWFGWVFIISACGLMFYLVAAKRDYELDPHCVMGSLFGGLHLAYGIYLYFTEQKHPAA